MLSISVNAGKPTRSTRIIFVVEHQPKSVIYQNVIIVSRIGMVNCELQVLRSPLIGMTVGIDDFKYVHVIRGTNTYIKGAVVYSDACNV